MADAPDALTTFPLFLSAPPQPPFPRELHGRPVLAVGAAYAGSIDEGLRVDDRRVGAARVA